MYCKACHDANTAIPGMVRTLHDFDRTDTHAKLAQNFNGIVKCHPQKTTACSVKSVLPNKYMYSDSIEGPEDQPTSCVYDLSVASNSDNEMLKNCAHRGEIVRFHRLWPTTNKWVFCGYYSVAIIPGLNAVRLTLVYGGNK